MAPTLSKVRKLKPLEVFQEIAQKEFCFVINCYWLRLESKKVLSEEQIEEALRILFRNMDILHLCIREEENGEFWFYKMAEEKILLQCLRNKSLEEFFENQTHTSFDSATGPLWRATYIINDDTDTEEERNGFTSNIMFAFDHAIADGYTAVNVCNSFLKVLNDVIGERVQKSYDFGHLDDCQETDEILELRLEYLKKNSEYFKEVKENLNAFDKQEIRYNEFFPVPQDVEKKTKFIHGEIDEETNKKIQNVFKSNGVSFHSGFSAVADFSIIELFTENGLNDERINLPSEHAINLRRYWKKSSTVKLGSHAAILKILSKADINIGNFWEHAKEFNKTLKYVLDQMQGMDSTLHLASFKLEASEVNYSEAIQNFPPAHAYYNTTNMGDLSSILNGKGDHVSIKWLARGASVHGMNIPLVLFFQTFEGKFIYCIGYSTHLLTDNVANQFVDKVINKLKFISTLEQK